MCHQESMPTCWNLIRPTRLSFGLNVHQQPGLFGFASDPSAEAKEGGTAINGNDVFFHFYRSTSADDDHQ